MTQSESCGYDTTPNLLRQYRETQFKDMARPADIDSHCSGQEEVVIDEDSSLLRRVSHMVSPAQSYLALHSS